jgi:CxxC motif-containing protein
VLTTTVALAGGSLPLLPVRSSGALPKESLFECLQMLSEIERHCPVDMGDVIVSDILDTGIDIIATRSA